MGLAWGFGYFFTQYIFEKENLDPKPLTFLFLGLFLSSFLGAKLFFLWFSAGPKIYQYIYANYFWLGGGFVFYGGLVFGLLYYFFYSLVLNKFDFNRSYLLLPGLIFGHAIGRVGCFLAGCCFGSPSNLPWSVKMQDEFRHPVQLYEVFTLLFLGLFILSLIKNKKSNFQIIATYLLTYSAVRFIIEFFRGDEIRGFFGVFLSTSQFISLVLFAATVIFIIFRVKYLANINRRVQ